MTGVGKKILNEVYESNWGQLIKKKGVRKTVVRPGQASVSSFK